MLTRIVSIDNDERETLVPDDPSIPEGITPKSHRTLGVDAEYQDTVNVMRRDTENEGCNMYGTLGVTYTAMMTTGDPSVPAVILAHAKRLR